MQWYEKLDLSKLSDDTRYRLFDYVVDVKKVKPQDLGVSHSTFSRVRGRKIPVSDSLLIKILQHLTPEEFNSLVSASDRLRVAGIVRDDGSVDYPAALELVKLILRDEYLKNIVLHYVVREFREDLRKLLGVSFAGVKLEWSEDFESFLAERKKRRKVRDPETIRYYRSLFERYLQGKELSEELIDYVIRHENKWLRNVFRHYIQYLYHKRKISPEAFGWIMEVVPSRGYKLDVRPYQISLDEVRKTIEFLRENHRVYYTVYRVMLESGARFEHILEMLRAWRPEEVVVIESIDLETKRLVCFDRFCRYYLELKGHQKPCEWVYMSRDSADLLKTVAPTDIDRRTVSRYAKRHGLVLPKMLRKVSWRIMVQAMPREVARFIQSRFGELKISEARYEDLLSEADKAYPRYLEKLGEIFSNSI